MQSGILCHLIGNAGPPCLHLEMRIWCQDGMYLITARVAKAYCQVVSCYIALQFNYGGRAVDVRLGGLSPQCQDTSSNASLRVRVNRGIFPS